MSAKMLNSLEKIVMHACREKSCRGIVHNGAISSTTKHAFTLAVVYTQAKSEHSQAMFIG